MQSIQIYDTTLRDGTQSEELSLSTEDKMRIATRLDHLGVAYIEGGWPGSNPKDKRFFNEMRQYELQTARLAAFGSTHAAKNTADVDPNLQALLESGAPVLTIFGKTWDIHVNDALKITLERNLELIRDSLAFLRPHCQELFYDAEHFFDGFKTNAEYAKTCLRTAWSAGADLLVLCDTNGGSLPEEIAAIMDAVSADLPEARFGIHVHNDCELAVANSLAAVRHGAVQVQGTINGYGERCGNANLSSIIPNLELKMGLPCLPPGNLERLTGTSAFVSEVANLRSFKRQPYTGQSAFTHKGGVHVAAVRRNPRTYEHIEPELVGNKRRIVLSDLAGQSNILFKAKQYGFELDKGDPFVLELLTELKNREDQGYEYSAAEASYELLVNRVLGRARTYFRLISFRILDSVFTEGVAPFTEATVMLRVGGVIEHTAATGKGPVNAMDCALRKGLERFYPNLKEMRLMDFKVRVLAGVVRDDGNSGTASEVRVLIESGDQKSRWTTVGVSYNIIEASRQALEDSINYKLFKDDQKKLTQAIREI
ncbi:MAG: citramalate synthase [Desulfovibrionales bacterium]|nr:citramalate synthase [Desulfovibrionales bacterium]